MFKKGLSIAIAFIVMVCLIITPIGGVSYAAYAEEEEQSNASDIADEIESLRYWGNTRYDTSFAIAEELYELDGTFDNVVLAYGGNFPDALSGGYLAKVKDAPLMLINKGQEERATAYISSHMNPEGTVYLLGGASVIRNEYEEWLKAQNFNVKRLAGDNALGTNLEILRECGEGAKGLLIATAEGFADSLSGSAVGMPMMLTRNGKLTSEQIYWIAYSGIRNFYILGGTYAVPETVAEELRVYGSVERVYGDNRYGTSDAIMRRFYQNPDTLTLVNGRTFPDGLSGAPLAMHYDSPIVLVSGDNWKHANAFKEDVKISRVITIGGTGAVSDATVNKVINGQSDSDDDSKGGDSELDEKVEKKLAEMTLADKVAQLFVVTPEALTGAGPVTMAGEMTKESINRVPVGGIIYKDLNLENASQTKTMLSNTQKYTMDRVGLPMFTCVDEEGGTVARIANNRGFPEVEYIQDMSEVGATGDVNLASSIGKYIGKYLNNLGFNVDFAPVADVLTNPDNYIVKYRSFGSDPKLVSAMSIAFAKGLAENGVYATYKHFPGHGATVGDTHEGYAYTNKTKTQLMKAELIPFKDAVNQGAEFIMVAHISLPNVIGNNTPASMSSVIMKDLLRGELGYKGIIITDALDMGAIANVYDSDEAVLNAFKAGADLMLISDDLDSCFNAILRAVRNGEIPESRVDESLRRIIKVKIKMLED